MLINLTNPGDLLNDLRSLPKKRIRRALYESAIKHSFNLESDDGFYLIKALFSEKVFAESEGLYHWVIDLFCVDFTSEQKTELLTAIFDNIDHYSNEVADYLGSFVAEKYVLKEAVEYINKLALLKTNNALTLVDACTKRLACLCKKAKEHR